MVQMDSATKSKITFIKLMWGALVIGLVLLVAACFLTTYIPRWVALAAVVVGTGFVPFFNQQILKLRKL